MPKITVEYPVKDRMAEFVTLLKGRAMDPAYEPIRDTIADFVDKFLVVELKRLQTSNEVITEELEIPQDVLMEPIRQARNAVDEQFRRLLGGEVLTVPEVKTEALGAPPAIFPDPPKTPRSGNGHAKMKVRDLRDSERDIISDFFMQKNGQIEDKDCVDFRKASLDSEVAIFQVTGFVSYLHNQIAMGKFEVGDMNAYLVHIQNHRNLWKTYDSPKYRAMRAVRGQQQS